MNAQAQDLVVQGIKTRVFTAGDHGHQVLLLHGGGIDSARLSWEPLIETLAPNFRVLAPDLPGYGDSARPKIIYSIQFYVDFVTAILDQFSFERVSLAGVSMGGAIALGLALQKPQLAEKLVLIDSYGLQSKISFHQLGYLYVRIPGISPLTWALIRSRWMTRESLKMLLRRPGMVTDELVEMTYEQIMRPDASRAFTSLQEEEMTWTGLKTCFMDRLSEIQAATLVMHGSKDMLVPPECSRKASQLIPGARMHWMEGCGHWPQRDNPDEFNRVVLEFLSE